MPRKAVSKEAKQEAANARAARKEQEEAREEALSPANEKAERAAQAADEKRSEEVEPADSPESVKAQQREDIADAELEERQSEPQKERRVSQVRVNINRQLMLRGLDPNGDLDAYELAEVIQLVSAAGGRMSVVDGSLHIIPER